MAKSGDISDSETERGFIIQREIELYKKPGDWFGITLALVSRRAIITSVRETEIYPTICAATRAGLNFGDEIVSVNGMLVNNVVTLAQAMDTLTNAKHLKLCIREMPFFRLVRLNRHSDAPIGVTVEDSHVIALEAGSAAERAGIKVGSAVVSVNGECMIGKCDNYVMSQIQRGWANAAHANELVITTMSPRKYRDLKAAVLQMPTSSRPSITSLSPNVVPSPKVARRSRVSLTPTTSPPLSPRRSEPAFQFFSPPPAAHHPPSRHASIGPVSPAARALTRSTSSLATALRRLSSAEGSESPPLSPKAIFRSFKNMAQAATAA